MAWQGHFLNFMIMKITRNMTNATRMNAQIIPALNMASTTPHPLRITIVNKRAKEREANFMHNELIHL